MRDKRPVDELSIEELERILAVRKREERLKRLRRMSEAGRRVLPVEPAVQVAPQAEAALPPAPVAAPERPAFAPAGSLPEEGAPRFEDDLAMEQDRTSATRNEARAAFWNMVWNRSLLVIEIAAFIGLILIGVQMFQALQTLNAETAAAQAQAQAFAGLPTPSPTPEIRLNRLVLPGGHTPPTSPGGAQFNFNEIPEQYRPVIQQQLAAPIALPTPSPESPTRLRIPRLNVDASVFIGTDWEALRRGVGYQSGTGLPGQPGNVVLSAHNDIYGELFRYLDQLQPGDEVVIYTSSRQYTYLVREWNIVSPYAVDVMNPTRTATATLISCYPYQIDNQRIVVFADLRQD